MTMTRSTSIMLVGLGAVLSIAAHGVVVWEGVTLSTKTGGWLPRIVVAVVAPAVGERHCHDHRWPPEADVDAH